MMDITAILHMHAELSLTAVFILMFLLDLFLPGSTTSLVTPHGMYPADHSTLSKPMAGRGDFIQGRHVPFNPYGVCSEKHPDHRYHTGFSTSRPLAKT